MRTRKQLYFICLLIFFTYFSCKQSPEPLPAVLFELEIIPYNEIPSSWDSTFYQMRSNVWSQFFDTTAADSLAVKLGNSGLRIRDFWFPQEHSECGIALRVGSEVILRLENVDTIVFQFGFQNADFFPLVCVETWRHYTFRRN